MIFEYTNDGTLREYLTRRFTNLSLKEKYKLGLEITKGLTCLHDLDIVHKHLVCSTAYLFVAPTDIMEMSFNFY